MSGIRTLPYDPLKERDLCAFPGPAIELEDVSKLFNSFKAVRKKGLLARIGE